MNNQTKVGLFSLITIIIFIFGFYFLKGINLFTTKNKFYAVFATREGLYKSNPVVVNGHPIGIVSGDAIDPKTGSITVEMVTENDFPLYSDCVASIASTDLVGSKQIDIKFVTTGRLLHSGDTLPTAVQPDIVSKLNTAIDPLVAKISATLANLDSVLHNVNGALGKQDPTSTINKLNAALDNIRSITAELDATLKKGTLDKTLDNLESITGNIQKNNDGIKKIITNFGDLTDSLKAADLAQTVGKARQALDEMDKLLHNINNGDGTISSLIKDKKVYNDIDSAILNLNALLADVKKSPFRYVNVSFFGGQKRDDRYKEREAKKQAQQKAAQ